MRIAQAIAITAALAALPGPARAESGVDWQKKVVKCTGTGVPNLRDAENIPAKARVGAERAAKLDALRNCLETLSGVQLQSGQTVGNALRGDAALSGRVQGIVKGFRVVGAPRYFSDGGVEMDVEVPLEGALSDALLPRGEPQAEPQPQPARSSPGGAAAGTSLVVDARGQKVLPALAPRVLDESGKEIYGPTVLGEQGRKAGGAVGYAADLKAARASMKDRVGDRPLVVKAVRTDGADVVISTADADGLKSKDLGFLAEAKVIILAD